MSAFATFDTDPAFDAAVSQHRPYLIRFARQKLRDPALVEDVVQETLLAALQGSARFEQKASLRTWLTGILLRRIADNVRREGRHASGNTASDAADDEDNDGEAAVHAVADDDVASRGEPIEWRDPQRMLAGRQFIRLLDERLAGMSALAVRAFTMREIDGMSTGEIARELGLDPAQCALLLHRTRVRLRDQLEHV